MTFVLTACGFVENTVKTSDTKAVERSATDMTRKTDSAINSADAPTVSNSPAVTAYEQAYNKLRGAKSYHFALKTEGDYPSTADGVYEAERRT